MQSLLQCELIDYVVSGEYILIGLNNICIEWVVNYIDLEQNELDLCFFVFGFDNDCYIINELFFILFICFWCDLLDDIYQGKLDIIILFLQSKVKVNSIKLGGFYNIKECDFNEVQYIYG